MDVLAIQLLRILNFLTFLTVWLYPPTNYWPLVVRGVETCHIKQDWYEEVSPLSLLGWVSYKNDRLVG